MGARRTGGLAFLALLFCTPFTPPAARAAPALAGGDRALPGCGICYPGGYELNTVGVLRGRLVELERPGEGPVRLVVLDGGERWVVLASPSWFWNRAGVRLVPGDIVTARGSKTLGADGTLYLVAQELLPPGPGAPITVRDRRGTPLWVSGRHGGGCR